MEQTLRQLQELEKELAAAQARWESLGDAHRGRLPPEVLNELRRAGDLAARLLPLLETLRRQSSTVQRERERLATLLEVSQLVNSTLKLEDLLEIVMDRAIAVTGAERGFLMLRDEAGGQLHFAVARNMRRQDIEENSFQVSQSVINRVAETAEPILTDNASQDPRFADSVSVAAYTLRSILCVPLQVKNRTIGVLYVDNRIRIGHFTPEDLSLLTAFANQAAVAIENARLFEHVCVLDRLKGDFLESVSHELRSPLTSLTLGLELAREAVQGADADLLDTAVESARRLSDIVERLTRFSEIEREGAAWIVAEGKQYVPLRELLGEALEAHRARVEEKGLMMNLVVEGEMVSLPVPRGLLRAFHELLSNAVAYTEKGVIFVTARRSGREILISVADTGIGVPSDEMPYIFDKLFRGRKVRALARTQGLGLGLAVARWVVENLGGRIWVESVEDKGSVFTIALPLVEGENGWQVRPPGEHGSTIP